MVGISSTADSPHMYKYSSSHADPIDYIKEISIYQRLFTIYRLWTYDNFITNRVIPLQDQVARKYFGKNIPYLEELLKNTSISFNTRNYFIHGARSLPPNIIDVRRLNIKKNEVLPKVSNTRKSSSSGSNIFFIHQDLQEFLDSATQGAVYFSFGSSVKTMLLDQSKLQIMANVLSQLPYKVMWKLENEHLFKTTQNLLIRKWFPQQDVFNHKNVKAFVTQGGMQSIEEAIQYKVPMVGIPFNGDQFMNVESMVSLGIAKSLDFNSLTRENLRETILKVVEDKR